MSISCLNFFIILYPGVTVGWHNFIIINYYYAIIVFQSASLILTSSDNVWFLSQIS